MKKILLLIILISLNSCSNNEDEVQFENTEKSNLSIENSSNRIPPSSSMTVTCVNVPTPLYTAKISWNFGTTIPYSDANAFIQIEPTIGSAIYTIANVPIPYMQSGDKLITASGVFGGPVGTVDFTGSTILIHAKTFNYRYIIFDNDSSNFVATNWQYFSTL